MKSGKKEEAIHKMIDKAVEAPVQDDQRDIEAAVLATLAGSINSGVSEIFMAL
jgi:hypothetical protein